ncbi:trimeric autotransporter adhesin [Variovorax sp. 54]|uniref:ESPR-type extended signal peptide-containing protein n=1 Tax=Variovorax sp. 54 TaxID=2035212 RepID=UPI000C175D93|nr:ESPR-type extended signal peptide-containing protein [Variovorax sp. 54]PIF78378.1 trimeric autotransporter adhesin [Variovorax sp. 54]
MNKSYRSIWNEALGAWVAASEIASARGKKSRSAQRQLAALGLGMLLLGGPALAQVGVMTPDPDPSAWLTIGPEPGAGVPNKGVLMPRAALTDATTWGLVAPTPIEGMVVFNTTAGTSANGLGEGLMTWKGGRWVNVDETPYLHVNSTAVGNSTQANSGAIGVNSVAIGPDAKAIADDTVAMGNGAEAHKLGDIAIGRAAIANGGDRLTGPTENWSSVAVGTYASATEGNSVALGGSAKAEGRGTALGSRAEAGYDAVAIGTYAGMGRPAKTDPNDFSNGLNTFVGSGSGASGNGARNSYVGNQAGVNVRGDENAGMGYGAGGLSVGSRNVAVGQRAGQFVTGDQNINQGTMAGLQSKGSNNIALGTLASANLALASQDPNSPVSAAAVQAASLAAQTEYMGFLATRGVTEAGLADGTYTLDASGNVIEASSGNVLVTATELQASVTKAFQRNGVAGIDASRTTAIGHQSRATSDDAVALGSSAVAGDQAAVAIGNASKAFGVSSVAVGDSAFAQGETSIAVGKGAQANGAQSISIGTGNVVNGNNSGAIGDPSVIDGANSYSVGNNNTLGAAATNTFVLGNNVNVNVANATALGDSTSVTVADGVALGSKSVASTDKGVAGFDPATGTASTDTSATWKSTLGAVSVGGNGQTRQITNVAAGTAPTDAVNVAQLKAGQTHYYSVNSTVTGAGSNYNNDGATGAGALAAGVGAQATGTDAVAIGAGAVSSGANGATSGSTVAVGVKSNANGFSSVAVGDRAIAANFADVSLGSEAGFSAGTGQYNTALGAGAGKNASGDHATAVGNGALSDSSGVFNTATGSGAGAGTAGDANAAFGALAGSGVTGNNNVAVGAAAGFGVTASDTVSVGGGALAGKDRAVALGYEAKASAVNSVALGAESQATQDAAALQAKAAYAPLTATGTPAAVAGTMPVGEVSVGSAGKERRITNLAAGADNTDAVNVAQLQAVSSTAAAGAVHYYSINSTSTGAGSNYDNSGATGPNAIAAGVNATSSGSGSTAMGYNSNATGAGAVAIGQGAVAAVASVGGTGGVAVGNGAQTVDGVALGANAVSKSGVAIGSSAQAQTSNTVSIGTQAGTGSTSAGGDINIGILAGQNSSGNGQNTSIGAGAGSGLSGQLNVSIGSLAGQGMVGNSNTNFGSQAGAASKGNVNTNLGLNAGVLGSGNLNVNQGAAAGAGVIGNGNVAIGAGANAPQYSVDPTTGAATPVSGKSALTVSNTVAVGNGTVAGANNAIAIGQNAQATGASSISIGTGNTVNGNNSGAIGDPSTIDGANSYSVGNNNTLGAAATNTFVLGNNVNINVANATALGDSTSVTVADGVALGSQSVASTDKGMAGFDPAKGAASTDSSATWKSTLGAVSVGGNGQTRQITNVAAGTVATDAVNVAQLQAAQTHYYSVNDNGTPGGNYANDGATGVNALAAGVGTQANGERSVSIGYLAGEGASAGLAGQNNVSVGNEAGRGVVGSSNTAVGSAAGKDVVGSSNAAFGIAAGQSVQGDYNLAMGVYSGIGTKGTYNTAIGGSAGQSVTGNDNIAMGDLSGASVSGDTNIGIGAVAGAGTTGSSNIAIGTFAGIVDTTTLAGITADNTVSIGNSAVASKNDGVAIGRQAQASAVNSVALGAESQATQDAAALQAKAAYAPLTAAGTPATVAGTVPVGEVSVGSAGKERRITNLAAGSDDTDAVNVSQLKAVDATANAGWSVAANGEATGGNVAPGAKVDFSNSDSNIAITRTGTDLDFKLADDVKVNNSVTVGQSVLNTTGLTVNDGAGSVTKTSATGTTVTNGTTTTAVAAGGVTSGTLNLSGVTNDLQGLSNKTLTDPSFATVGRAATEEQLKIVNDTASAGWNVAANGEATGGNVAPGGKVDFSNSDNNVTITRSGTNLDFKLADDVKVNNSVTVGQSVLNTTGLTVNNGTTTTVVAAGGVTSGNVNLSGVTNDIKGLSNTTLTDSSFATVGRGATEEQLKIVNDTASAGWNVAANGEATGGNVAPGGKVDFSNSDSNIAITRSGTNLDFKLADDVKVNNSVTVGQSVLSTTGLTVNNGTTTTAVAATGVTSGNVNLSGVTNDIKGLSNTTLTDPSFATVGRGATEEQLKVVNDTASAGWNVAANGEATGGNVAPGGKVDFSNSDSNIAITRTGTNLDVKLADDVKVNNSVTVGQSVLNTTGLTVNNGTTTTSVAAGGVTSGNVNLSGVTNDIQGLSNTTLSDPTFATVGRGATEEQLKLVNDTASAGWNVAANGEATGGNVASGGKVDFSNSDSNIAITRTGTNLDFKLADDVKVNNSVTVGQSVLNTTGLTVNNGTTTTAVAAGGVTSGTVNLSGVTNDIQGLSNKTLTDPTFATVGRGATEEQLKLVNDTASAGWNVAANGEATGGNVAPGGKVDFSNSDSNIAITRTGTNLDFKLADDVKVNNSVTVGQSVLNTTGLTVNNGTTTTAVAAGGVTSGTVNLSGVTNDIKGLSNKTLTDPSFATVGRAASEEQLKLVNDTASAGWNVAANGEATGGNVAPGGKVDFSNSDSNIAITRSGTNLDFKLADDVKVNNSVTVGQSVLNTTGLTVNNGTTTTAVAAGGVTSGSVNLSGVTNDIKGLSNKTLTDPTFATVGRGATEEQLKLVNDTASAGWNVAANGEATGGNVAPGGKVDLSNSDSNIAITRNGTDLDFKLADDVKVNNSVTVGQSVLNTTGLTVNDGAGNVTKTTAAGTTVTNGTTTTVVAAGGVTSGNVKLSGVTNDIQGLSNTTLTDPSFATVGRAATEEQLKLVDTTASKGWNVAANGEATGGNVAPGGKVDFSNSDSNIAITRSGTDLDFKLADDVKVNNSVTVGQSVLNTTGLTVNDGAGNVTKTSAAGTTVTNGTTTTVVAASGVTSGTVNLSGVTNDIRGLSNKTLTDPTFATVGRGATEEQLKLVNDTASAGWNVAANGEATGGNVAPGGKVDFSNSDSNIAITRNGTGLDFKLADDVKVNNSLTVGQSVLNTTGLTVNDGTGNITKTSAAGTTVTNGTTTTAVAAGGVTSGSVNLSGVSNDIKGLSNKTLTDPSFATVGRAATEEQLKLVDVTASKGWNLSANGEASPQNIAPGGTANFANGDNMVVTRNGNTLTVATAKDVKFDSVTTGDTVMNNAGVTVGPNVTLGATGLTIVGGPSVTTAGVNAGGKVITNVAPGVANTDAVNVSQLKDTVAESKTKYYSVNSTGGGNENNDGATGADAIAAGKDAQATAVNAVAMGTAAQAAGISATSIGNAAWAMGDRSTAVGYFSTANGIDSAAFGAWARAMGNGSLAAGAGANAAGVASLAVGAGSTAVADGGAALGAGSVADRAAGAKGYVPPDATAAQSDAIAKTTSTTGAVGVGDVANGVFRQITGVAAGSAPSDAVNVAQLQAVASQAAAAGNKWITGSPTTYVAPTSKGADSTAVGSGAVVNADKGVAVGTGAVVTTKNSVALGNDSKTSDAKPTESVTIRGTTYEFAGTKPVGVVSVGDKGAERQITNVAAGEISATSTDAVNGSQLNATNQAINNLTTGGTGIKYFHANSKEADSSAIGAESVAIGPKAVATGNNAIATGNGAQAKAAGSIALGANSTASSANSVALGDGAVANRAGMNGQREMFSNTVVQSAQGAVSVGSAGNERQITNVAGGTQATDAVNVRQLQAVQQSAVRYDTNVDGSVNYNSVTMGNGASTGPVTMQNVAPGVAPTDAVNVQQLNQSGAANMAYTDARANALGGEIRNVAKNAYAGVAAAMAVQMPGTSVPGKTVMRVGYGTFKGESAVGISFRRTAENNGWSMTGGVGMSRAGAAATVGAEWVFN